jgi:Bifunctional DNA primase/polymerase, N-terminal
MREAADDEVSYVQTLVDTASRLVDRGLPVVPANGKKPLGGRGWHRKTFTYPQIADILSKQDEPAIGLRLGPDSLIDIEADSAEEELLVAELLGGQGKLKTPTFKSKRGLHRLFQFPDRLAQTGRGIVHFLGSDGAKLGIRIGANGKGAQSIIPPSKGRTWLPGLSIFDCDAADLPAPAVDRILLTVKPSTPESEAPMNLVLDNCINTDTEFSNSISRTQIQNNNGTQIYDQIRTQQDTAFISLCPSQVEEAISATLPSRPGYRNRQLFAFARYLKGMSEYRDCSDDTLQPLVWRWHQKAWPYIATKEFGETWRDFRYAWSKSVF